MTIELSALALSALASSAGLLAVVAYKVRTAPKGYEDSSGFHYGTPTVELARCPHRSQILDVEAARRRQNLRARV